MSKAVLLENVSKAGEHLDAIMAIVMLQVMRAINPIELSGGQVG
jgi:hypothetical protein